ncbi:MAG: glycosyltransferase [Cyclobacteriaceae bacterium]|nr:glycosyltransferase [Cyclobacteriaceae bacterium]
MKRIGNVPHYLPEGHISTKSNPKQPVFGTVALISPMKNIHNIINALSQIKADLNYSLYGPVKDTAYWQECQKLIARLPSNIRFEYHGSIQPHEVEKMIAGFDFYIQPSKSENFGHSIFEAFNQGVPVIISDQTPWKNLYAKHAGWDVDVSKSGSLESAIRQSLAMDMMPT